LSNSDESASLGWKGLEPHFYGSLNKYFFIAIYNWWTEYSAKQNICLCTSVHDHSNNSGIYPTAVINNRREKKIPHFW